MERGRQSAEAQGGQRVAYACPKVTDGQGAAK